MSTSYRAARTSRASLRRSSLAAGFLAALHASGASHAAQEETVLAPVTVSAAEEGGLGLKQAATTGSRLRLTPLETPASVDILPGETVRARGDATLIEAAARAPGITQSGTSGGGALAARGFAGNTSVMRLYDGTRMYVSGGTVSFPFDPWMAERMEVLRGPASVLYGEGAIGGAINTIPKKPQRGEIAHEAWVAYGSDDTWRTAYGSGGAVDERWSYRFDVSRNRSDGYVDRGGSDTLAAAAAVRLDVSPAFNLTLSHDYGRLQPMRYFGVPLINGKLDSRLRETNYNVADARLQFRDNWTRLDLEWQAAEGVVVRNQLYRLNSRRDWRNAESYRYNANGSITRSSFLLIGYELEQVGNRLDSTWQGSVLGLPNELVLGFDVNRLRYYRDRNNGAAAETLDAFAFDPGNFPTKMTNAELFKTNTRTLSLFMEDKLKLAPRWSLVGGLRWDRIDVDRTGLRNASGPDFEKTFTHASGRLGAVFAVTPELSLYGQYATAADPLTGVVNTTAQQSQFDMSTGKQAELGVKQRFDGGRGEWSLATYWIRKEKLLVRDAADPNVYQQVGAQSSRGVELALAYAVTRSLRIDANGTVLNARYDDFNEAVGSAVVSRSGRTPSGVPERAANLWLEWDFMRQWQAGLGARYVGPRYVDNGNAAKVAAYTVVDATLSWQLRRDLRLSLFGYNLFDRDYAQTTYSGNNQWVLGRPRSVEVAAHFTF